jgi:hypothetical protein
MRRIEFSRTLEEASRGVRGELLNRKSGVRIPAPAPQSNSKIDSELSTTKRRIANV